MEDADAQQQKPTPKTGPVYSKEVQEMGGNPEEVSEKLKNEGNEAFKVGDFNLAILKYSQSLGKGHYSANCLCRTGQE